MNIKIVLLTVVVLSMGILALLLVAFLARPVLLSAFQGLAFGSTLTPELPAGTRVPRAGPPPNELSNARVPQQATPTGQPAAGGSGAGRSATAAPRDTSSTPSAFRPGSVVTSPSGVSVTLPVEQRVTIKVGQKLIVIPPLAGADWNVTFDANKLELAPGLNPNHPPAEGWTWTAYKAGATEISFSLQAPPCDPKNQQCPGMPSFQTVLPLDISP